MRFLKVLIIFVFLCNLTLFGGCGKENGNKQGNQATTKSESKTKIKFAIWDYSLAPEYKEVIDAFQKKNKNISVEVTDISAKEYPDKVTIMLAGGEDTDVLGIKDIPSYSGFIAKNQIIALDDRISKDKLDITQYKDVLNEVKQGGKLYQLPYRSDIWIMYYNKKVFDAAKQAYPTNNLTFDEFRTIAKKITSGEGNDKVYGAYVHTWKSCVANWEVANGKGTLIDGKYEFLKPAYEVFLKMQNEDKSVIDYATAKTQNAHYLGQFESGKVGMVLMGSWFIGQLISDKKAGKHNVDWGIAKAPHFNDGKEGMTFGTVTGLAINQKSSNKDAAWEFVKFMGTEEGAKYFANRGILPAYKTKDVMDSYLAVDGFPKTNQGALDTTSVKLEFPPAKNSAAIDKALQEEHELIMIGKNNISVGLKEMDKRVKEINQNN